LSEIRATCFFVIQILQSTTSSEAPPWTPLQELTTLPHSPYMAAQADTPTTPRVNSVVPNLALIGEWGGQRSPQVQNIVEIVVFRPVHQT